MTLNIMAEYCYVECHLFIQNVIHAECHYAECRGSKSIIICAVVHYSQPHS